MNKTITNVIKKEKKISTSDYLHFYFLMSQKTCSLDANRIE